MASNSKKQKNPQSSILKNNENKKNLQNIMMLEKINIDEL